MSHHFRFPRRRRRTNAPRMEHGRRLFFEPLESRRVLTATLVLGVVFLLALPRAARALPVLFVALAAFAFFGGYERLREGIRKPYLIHDYTFSNGIPVGELARLDVVKVLMGHRIGVEKDAATVHQHLADQAPLREQTQGVVHRRLRDTRPAPAHLGVNLLSRAVLRTAEKERRYLHPLLGGLNAVAAEHLLRGGRIEGALVPGIAGPGACSRVLNPLHRAEYRSAG